MAAAALRLRRAMTEKTKAFTLIIFLAVDYERNWRLANRDFELST